MKVIPLIIVIISLTLGFLVGSFSGNFLEQSSINGLVSQDHVKQEQITVTGDKVFIDLEGKNIRWAEFEDTNSMLPLMDKGHNGLEYVPQNKEDINVGDVISFEYNGNIYVHRVIKIGEDELGWYAITKGDNNNFSDVGKRRFENILGVLIGVVF